MWWPFKKRKPMSSIKAEVDPSRPRHQSAQFQAAKQPKRTFSGESRAARHGYAATETEIYDDGFDATDILLAAGELITASQGAPTPTLTEASLGGFVAAELEIAQPSEYHGYSSPTPSCESYSSSYETHSSYSDSSPSSSCDSSSSSGGGGDY